MNGDITVIGSNDKNKGKKKGERERPWRTLLWEG
jgi:hypothetical protein